MSDGMVELIGIIGGALGYSIAVIGLWLLSPALALICAGLALFVLSIALVVAVNRGSS